MNHFLVATSAIVLPLSQDALENVVGYSRTDAEMTISMRAG